MIEMPRPAPDPAASSQNASLNSRAGDTSNSTAASSHGAKQPHPELQHRNLADLMAISNSNRGDRLQETRVWVASLTDSDIPEPATPVFGPGSGPLMMSRRGSVTGEGATAAAAAVHLSPSAGSGPAPWFTRRPSEDSLATRRGGALFFPDEGKGAALGGRGEPVVAAGGRSSNRCCASYSEGAATAPSAAAAAVVTAAVGAVSLRSTATVAAIGHGGSSTGTGGSSSALAEALGSLPPGPQARSSSALSSAATVSSTHSSLLELLDAAAGMPHNGAVPPPSSPLGSPTAAVTVTATTSSAPTASILAAAGILIETGSPFIGNGPVTKRMSSYTTYGREHGRNHSLRTSYQGEQPPAVAATGKVDGEAPLLSAYVALMPSAGSAPLNEHVRIASKRQRSASDGLWSAMGLHPHQHHRQHPHQHPQQNQHGQPQARLLDPNSPTHLPIAVPQWRQHQHQQLLLAAHPPLQQQQQQQQPQQPQPQRPQSLENQRLPLVWAHGAVATPDQGGSAHGGAGGGGSGSSGAHKQHGDRSHRRGSNTNIGAAADAMTNIRNSNNSVDNSDVGSHCSTDSDGLRLPPLLQNRGSLRASVDGEPSAAAAAAAACRPRPAGHSLFTDSLDEFDGWQHQQQPLQLQSPPAAGSCGSCGYGARGPGRLSAAPSRSGTGYGTAYGSDCAWEDSGGGDLSTSQLRSNSYSTACVSKAPAGTIQRPPAYTASGTIGGVSASTAVLMAGVRAFHRESAEMCAKAISVAELAATEVERRVYGCAVGSPPVACRSRPPATSSMAPVFGCEPAAMTPSGSVGALRGALPAGLRSTTGSGEADGEGGSSPATALAAGAAAAAAAMRDSPMESVCSPMHSAFSPKTPVGAVSPYYTAAPRDTPGAAAGTPKARLQAHLLVGLQPPSPPAPPSPSATVAASSVAVRAQPAGVATRTDSAVVASSSSSSQPPPQWTSSFSSSCVGTAPASPLSPRPAAAGPQPPPGVPPGTARMHTMRPPASTAPADHRPLHQSQHSGIATAAATLSPTPGAAGATIETSTSRRHQPAPPTAPAPLPACRSHRTSQLMSVSEKEPAPPAS